MNIDQRNSWSRAFGFLVIALLAGVLAGCGGGGGSGDASTPIATVPAASPAAIVAQPGDQSVVAGGNVTFTVSASGAGLSFQWQRSTDAGVSYTNVAGATAASYTVVAPATSLNGSLYRVVVASTAGNSVTSSAVKLNVAPAVVAPAITVDVTSASVLAGADAVFTVTATGTSVAYQWQASLGSAAYADVAGATTSTLTLPAVLATDTGKSVRVVVSNSAGSVTSSVATLTVTPPASVATAPAITLQPVAVSVTAPSPAVFSAQATGNPAPTYQWQKSIDAGVTFIDVAGATKAGYTTPATTVGDSSSRFRVNVSNSAGTTASTAATLTVTAAPTAPVIGTPPASVSVFIPTAASFTVVATGVPSPTYQWQISTDGGTSFANITGATAATYQTAASVVGDNGKRYRVVVTNSAGTTTSAAALLTASVPASPLSGRAWTTGQALETDDRSVIDSSVDIDDAGNAISVFVKSNGTRNVLYATRGVPGAAGSAPVWSAPVAIDSTAAPAAATTGSTVATRVTTVAPSGNAVVTWVSTAACTAATYSINTASRCNFLYSAKYDVAANTWSAPVAIADTPDGTPDGTPTLLQRVNNRGDFVLLYPGWVRTGTSGYTARTAVLWQAAGQTTVRSKVFDDSTLALSDVGIDKDGNLIVAGQAAQNATTDIVVYRGTTAAGFGAQEVIDQRLAAANFDRLTVGVNGQAIVTWTQNNGTASTIFAADIVNATAAWSVKEVGADSGFAVNSDYLVISDNGQATYARVLNGSCSPYFYKYVGGVWSTKQSFASGLASYACNGSLAVDRNGDLVLFQNFSFWTTYDGASNTIVRGNSTGATSVYGTTGGTLGTRAFAVSISGVAVAIGQVAYDTLPTVAQPAGDGRTAVINLWGLFLK